MVLRARRDALYHGSRGGQSIGTGVTGWEGAGGTGSGFGNARFIFQNASGSTLPWVGGLIPIPNNTLMLDPQGGTVSVVFTAPSAGTYTIDGSFFGVNTEELSHPVVILKNGVSVWSGTIASYNQPDAFDFSESLAAGGTITFEVESGGDGHSLGTGLVGTVTEAGGSATPEPGAIFLTAGGLLAAALTQRIRRSKPA